MVHGLVRFGFSRWEGQIGRGVSKRRAALSKAPREYLREEPPTRRSWRS